MKIALVAGLLSGIGFWVAPREMAWSQPKASVASTVDAVRAYAAQYDRTAASMVAHERYVQNVTFTRGAPQSRVLQSEVIVLRLPGQSSGMWFRDVYEVDGRRIRDRDQRLMHLLEHPAPTAFEQARRIAAEGARFNAGRVERTMNVPDLVFAYLLAPEGHVRFTAMSDDTLAGERVEALRFEEVGKPTVVRRFQGRDAPARGRVWVVPGTAAIVRSEVIVGAAGVGATTTVDFVVDPRLPVRIPSRMTERFAAGGEVGTGTATYTDLRVFGITTSEQFRKPPGG